MTAIRSDGLCSSAQRGLVSQPGLWHREVSRLLESSAWSPQPAAQVTPSHPAGPRPKLQAAGYPGAPLGSGVGAGGKTKPQDHPHTRSLLTPRCSLMITTLAPNESTKKQEEAVFGERQLVGCPPEATSKALKVNLLITPLGAAVPGWSVEDM